MSRTNSTAFDSQSTVNATITVPVVDLANNYGKDDSKKEDESTYANSMAGVDRTLLDYISIRSRKKAAAKFDLKPLYPSTSNSNIEIGVMERFILRTTETDGTVHEDPTKIWFNLETNYGANIISGQEAFALMLRALTMLVDITVTEGVTSIDYTRLDQMLRGSTAK
jgi:hypothetical protein